jgi:hypothetical protein
MDQEARAELLRRNAEAQASLQRDIADRQQRRRDGEFDHENPPPRQTSTAMTAGERQVGEHLQRQRPTLDPVTQARWDDWANGLINAALKEFKSKILYNQFTKVMGQASAEAMIKHEKRLREDIQRQQTEWISKKNREFALEVDLMTSLMVKRVTADLNVMRDDMLAVLRRDIADEMLKTRQLLNIDTANVTDIKQRKA